MRISAGDILAIPVTEDAIAFAQVVRSHKGSILVAVMGGLFPPAAAAQPPDIHSDDPLLIVDTLDGSLVRGEWKVVGHQSVSDDVPVPIYKVPAGPDRQWHLQDIHGRVIRPATQAEADLLRIPKTFSPVGVEKAIRAANGIEPWRDRFDDLRPDWIRGARSAIPNAD